MTREYFKSIAKLADCLAKGSKIGCRAWNDDEYVYAVGDIFVDEDHRELTTFSIDTSDHEMYYDWELQQKTIDISQLYDYLNRGAHLVHESWKEPTGYIFKKDGWVSITLNHPKCGDVAFSIGVDDLTGKWIVIKEPEGE